MNLCYLDFEFNGVSEPRLNLVSVSALCTVDAKPVLKRDFWLHQYPKGHADARKFFSKLMNEGYIFVAYVMEAEARSLLSLYGDDRTWLKNFKCFDLYLEYRNVLNHHNKFAYGPQYVKGEIITTSPPPNKWKTRKSEQASQHLAFKEFKFENSEADDEAADAHHKPQYSLASAVYKLLAVQIDTTEKNEVRDIIIEGNPQTITANAERIQKYNASDIEHLPKLLASIFKIHKEKGETLEGFVTAALKRGDYAVATARMLATGYPVNQEKVLAFTANVEGVLNESIEECLEHSAEVESFRFDKKDGKYKANQANIKGWIKAQEKPYWRKTKGNDISLSKDAFKDWYNSDSPGFPGAFCRHLKTKQSLNGFIPSKTSKKGSFKDFIGSDGRVRPYFGIFGSQSSRSQPGATGYLWLKSKWMQNFLEAKPGRALAAVDFASQEFLVAAILSQDTNMIDAYASGDVYLAFGKLCGMIPADGTKETHRKEREICKQIILGMSYGMTSIGLAPRLSAALGRTVLVDEAQKYVTLFETSFPTYDGWKDDVSQKYQTNGHIQLSDGWTMWGDNDNERSVTNFPTQGEGAVILRESVRLCHEAGLDVVATVHDSIVIECDSITAPGSVGDLQRCMIQGFENVMKRHGRTAPIRVEGECWSLDFPDTVTTVGNIKYMREFVHEKAVADFEKYKKYLTPLTHDQKIAWIEKQVAAKIEETTKKLGKIYKDIAEVKVKRPRKPRLRKGEKPANDEGVTALN